MKLKNKVAVVAGGDKEIGLEIAEEFKENGADVVIFGGNSKTLNEANVKWW